MSKTAKFAISMPEAEFRGMEVQRRRVKMTRSAFVLEAVRAWRRPEGGQGTAAGSLAPGSSVKEDPGRYGHGTPARETPEPEYPKDIAELRRRAIAAAGRFRSDVGDLSASHDKYLEDDDSEIELALSGHVNDRKKPGGKP
jgi:hypothetical protein